MRHTVAWEYQGSNATNNSCFFFIICSTVPCLSIWFYFFGDMKKTKWRKRLKHQKIPHTKTEKQLHSVSWLWCEFHILQVWIDDKISSPNFLFLFVVITVGISTLPCTLFKWDTEICARDCGQKHLNHCCFLCQPTALQVYICVIVVHSVHLLVGRAFVPRSTSEGQQFAKKIHFFLAVSVGAFSALTVIAL